MQHRLDIEQNLVQILNVLTTREFSPMFYSSTTTGTIAAGASKISIVNSGGVNATITSAGTSYSLEPNEVIVLDPGFNRRNDIITFDATGTTIKYILYR